MSLPLLSSAVTLLCSDSLINCVLSSLPTKCSASTLNCKSQQRSCNLWKMAPMPTLICQEQPHTIRWGCLFKSGLLWQPLRIFLGKTRRYYKWSLPKLKWADLMHSCGSPQPSNSSATITSFLIPFSHAAHSSRCRMIHFSFQLDTWSKAKPREGPLPVPLEKPSTPF